MNFIIVATESFYDSNELVEEKGVMYASDRTWCEMDESHVERFWLLSKDTVS